MIGLSEHRVAGKFRGEAKVAQVGELLGLGNSRVDAADHLDVPGSGGLRRMLPEVRWVTVVPTHVSLVDRLDIVTDRPVVAVGVCQAESSARGISIISAISVPT